LEWTKILYEKNLNKKKAFPKISERLEDLVKAYKWSRTLGKFIKINQFEPTFYRRKHRGRVDG
jgi:hypothetical protein